MEVNPLDSLTERERDCLRLVARGSSSKEIAAELGISHHTVDLHLKRAMRALGVTSRRDAARRLAGADAEGQVGIQQLVTQPAALAEPAPQLPIMPATDSESAPLPRVPFLRLGRRTNELTGVQRLFWSGALALILLLVIANFLNGLGVLFDITA